ncbi:MAG: hypothetical protein WCC87_09295 [Candidatus Korobacteraceae bacterium]
MNGGIFLLVWCLAQSFISPPTAVAQTTSFAQRLYGTWYNYPPGKSTTDSVRYEFRHNSEISRDEIVAVHICAGEAIAVIARATAPIEVSENTIKILQNASRSEKKAGGAECQASIDSAVWNYVISPNGDRITITNPGGDPNSFQLARQDLAPEAVLSPSLYGSWLMPVHQERGATVAIKLIFYESADKGRGKIREISTCSKANDTLLAQADSTFKMTADEMTILEAASREERNGAISCLATIAPGTLHYVISPEGGTLVLSKPGAPPIILTRDEP